MGQIDDLVEYWIESNKLPFGNEGVECITKKLQSYIDFCDTLPIEDKIKALSFLYDKCDYILNRIASSMNYQLEYEPTDDEIWDFIEQERKSIDMKSGDLPYWKSFISEDSIGYIECFDESVIYEYVIDPMREKYKKQNKEASEWCDQIEEIQTNIYKAISLEKENQSFFNEVFSSKIKAIKTTMDECLVNCDVEVIKPKLSRLLLGGKGNSVAAVIFALKELRYTKEDIIVLYEVFKNEFGITGTYNAVTGGFRLIERYGNDRDPKDGNRKKLFEKMEIIMAELKQ